MPPRYEANMQVSNSLPGASAPAFSRMNPRIVTAAVTVLAGHALLLTGALLMRNDVPHRPLESKTITAQLLSAPVAQPAGIQSAPAPTPPPLTYTHLRAHETSLQRVCRGEL